MGRRLVRMGVSRRIRWVDDPDVDGDQDPDGLLAEYSSQERNSPTVTRNLGEEQPFFGNYTIQWGHDFVEVSPGSQYDRDYRIIDDYRSNQKNDPFPFRYVEEKEQSMAVPSLSTYFNAERIQEWENSPLRGVQRSVEDLALEPDIVYSIRYESNRHLVLSNAERFFSNKTLRNLRSFHGESFLTANGDTVYNQFLWDISDHLLEHVAKLPINRLFDQVYSLSGLPHLRNVIEYSMGLDTTWLGKHHQNRLAPAVEALQKLGGAFVTLYTGATFPVNLRRIDGTLPEPLVRHRRNTFRRSTFTMLPREDGTVFVSPISEIEASTRSALKEFVRTLAFLQGWAVCPAVVIPETNRPLSRVLSLSGGSYVLGDIQTLRQRYPTREAIIEVSRLSPDVDSRRFYPAPAYIISE